MGIGILAFFLLPCHIQRSHTVQVEHVLPAIGAQETLGLNTAFEIMALVILVPHGVRLDSEGLGQLFKDGDEIGVGRNNILAFHTTIVDLVLTWLPLLENTGNDALTNDTLTHVVNDHSSWGEQAIDV